MRPVKTERQKLVEQYQNLQTNDELLAAQAQYYKQKQKSNGQMKNKTNSMGQGDKPKTSKFKQQQQQSNAKNPSKPKYKESTFMIGNILEKNTKNIQCHNNQSPKLSKFRITEKGFPAIIKHNESEIKESVAMHQKNSMWHHQQFINNKDNESSNNKRPKLSLFAQKMQKMQSKSNKNEETNDAKQPCNVQNGDEDNGHKLYQMLKELHSLNPVPSKNDDSNKQNNDKTASFIEKINSSSNIVTKDEITKIQSENDTFLSQQSESEIMQMRQQLLSSLDPKLIELLTNKPTNEQKPKQPKKKRKKVKVAFDTNEEIKEENSSNIKSKTSVIRKPNSLPTKLPKSKNKTKLIKEEDDNKWQHPSTRIKSAFDLQNDRNNDAPGPTQKEKMEWMEPINVKAEKQKYTKSDAMPMMLGDNPLSYYRFGFDGEVLCDNKGIKRQKDESSNYYNHGLHHHGDEPLKPGYTINELLHLCKSTVANQRSAAIKTFVCIIRRMRAGEYGMDHSEYLWVLLQEKQFCVLLIDILSIEKNVSCIIPILDCLHALIVPLCILFDDEQNMKHYNAQSEQLIFDSFHILCNVLPNVTPIQMKTNQFLFRDKLHKNDQYEQGSLDKNLQKKKAKNEQTDIWKCDVILAMIRNTKIIKYFVQIFDKYGLHKMHFKNMLPSLLDIVMTLSVHHPEIVDKMVKTKGFMQHLLNVIFDENETMNDAMLKCKAMDILCVMGKVNKICVEYLSVNHKLTMFKMFIVDGVGCLDNSEKIKLSISALQLWRVCIKYGFDLNAFTDILPKLLPILNNFDQSISDKVVYDLRQRQIRCLLNVICIILENLTPSNVKTLPQQTNVTWNQMAKISEKILFIFDDAINKDTNNNLMCVGGLLFVISAYFKTLKQQNNESVGQSFDDFYAFAQKQCMKLTKKYIATWNIQNENALLHSLLLNKQKWTHKNAKNGDLNKKMIQFPFLDGLLADIPLSIAVIPTEEYLIRCDTLLGIIKMVQSFVAINSNIISILIRSKFIAAISRILMQITCKHFHFRLNRSLRGLLFNYWRIEFLLAFEILSLCNLCPSDLCTLSPTNVHSAACVLLECLPPGYAHYGDTLLTKYILSRKYLGFLKKTSIKYMKKGNKKHCLLDDKLTSFYVESDLNSFRQKLVQIYTKKDLHLPNVFDKSLRLLCQQNHSFDNVSRIESLCCVPTMIPTFWMLQPLINLYKHRISDEFITILLHFLFIISRSFNDDFMQEIIDFDDESDEEDEDDGIKSHHYWCNIAVWDTYRTIGTLYLCDSNIYCDDLNRALMTELINGCWNRICYAQQVKDKNDIYLCDKNDPSSACIIDKDINELDICTKSLGREWEGFYAKLVEQFESDSFGDELFGKLILFQQQMAYNKRFRTILWASIDSLGILLKHQYPQNVYSWKAYFVPFESDKTIIECQFQAIVANKFCHSGNCSIYDSFLYFVAVVEVSHYIWSNRNDGKKNKKYEANMLRNVLNQCSKAVICDIVNCEYENINSLMIQEDGNSDYMKQLKECIKCGKQRIEKKERIKILKNDFAALCKNMDLF